MKVVKGSSCRLLNRPEAKHYRFDQVCCISVADRNKAESQWKVQGLRPLRLRGTESYSFTLLISVQEANSNVEGKVEDEQGTNGNTKVTSHTEKGKTPAAQVSKS